VISLEQFVAAAVAIGIRVSGLMLFAPVIGSPALPARAKAALVIAITALLFPNVHARVPLTGSAWLAVGMSELTIGVLLGLTTTMVFEAVQFAGHVLGVQMGYSLVTVLDPTSQADTPVLSLFYQMLATLIFLRLNVHHWLLRGLASSFDLLPSGTLLSGKEVVQVAWHATGAIWVCGLQIAAPALAATMIADLILAFIGKASPQLPVMLIGISLKSALGLLTTIAALAFWPSWIERHFSDSIIWSERLLHLAR
jgi:flagellar biosynthetic protein FliR